MSLPIISGEFGVVAEPEIKFSGSGKAWMGLRVVAKDRVRDSNGEWTDGDPMFLNAVVFGKYAENLAESILKGDTILIKGKLRPNNWTDREGNERNDVQIVVDEVGVSVKWTPAKSERMLSEGGGGSVENVKAAFPGATEEPSSDEPPF